MIGRHIIMAITDKAENMNPPTEGRSLLQIFYHLSYIPVNADGPVSDLVRTCCLTIVHAGVDSIRIAQGHLPERILDDHRRIVSNAQFEIQDLALSCMKEIIISFRNCLLSLWFIKDLLLFISGVMFAGVILF